MTWRELELFIRELTPEQKTHDILGLFDSEEGMFFGQVKRSNIKQKKDLPDIDFEELDDLTVVLDDQFFITWF